MSREPRLGSPGRAPAGQAASHQAGRKLITLRDAALRDGAQRAPLGSQARPAEAPGTGPASTGPASTGPASTGSTSTGSTSAGVSSTRTTRTGPPRHVPAQPADGSRTQRPSLSGGIPAQQRGLGPQAQKTVSRLLEAGLAVFEEMGLQAARVEDIVRRANTSHGTFYLYFANKDDLFRTLLRDALHDIGIITDEFPVVTGNEAGRAALRRWVQRFSDIYAAHATVIRIVSQSELVSEEVYADGLQLLFRLAETMTQGMTAAQAVPGALQDGEPAPHAELTAVACLMMLERVNYLLCAEVKMPRDEMNDRLTAIIYAAFRSS